VSQSQDDRFADLLDKSANEPAATGSSAHHRRHGGHQ